MQLERRKVSEARTDGSTLEGYAAVFDSPSLPMQSARGEFVETIAPGAFARSIAESQVFAYYDHLDHWPLARTPDTLQLKQDSRGLWFRMQLPRTSYGQDVETLLKDGVLDGSMSFGFRSRQDAWERRNGMLHRTLLDVDLVEVSIVQRPAYPETSSGLRGRFDLATSRRRLAIRTYTGRESLRK